MAGVRCGGRPWRVGRRHPLVGRHGSQLACLGRHTVTLRLSIPSQGAQVTMPHDIFISYSLSYSRRDLAAENPIKEERKGILHETHSQAFNKRLSNSLREVALHVWCPWKNVCYRLSPIRRIRIG